ncbi:MAG: hypothetical protein COB38_03850 [Gammaproteobacteria bacterium]|nr:MAG: hypothetical protein COB38_03850 [Gammaproteobacteria bacterium]
MDTPTINHTTIGSFEIKINRDRHFAHIIFEGEINIVEINNAYMALMDHSLFKHNMNVCNDYSNALLMVSVPELQEHASVVAQYAKQRGNTYKLAMVSNETFSSAFLGMYKVRISETNVDTEVFGSTKSALRWLER